MITLTATDFVTMRGRRYAIVPYAKVTTDIQFIDDEWTTIQNILEDEVFTFHSNSFPSSRTITVPILYDLITNTRSNILISFKSRNYIVGKNLIFSYDVDTGKATPMMLHVIKRNHPRGLRDSRIVMNPELFSVDSAFKKLFEVILQTGVDVELTKFIEEKYYLKADLPKFGNLSERKRFLEDSKGWILTELLKKTKL